MNKEIFEKLSEPFEPDEVEWRIGNTNADKTKGTALAYLTARAVMNRLDEVVGAENWSDRYIPAPAGGGKAGWLCELSLKIGDTWITKSDGADESDIEPIKGGISDALKRAAVKWGVGRYLYNLPVAWVTIEPAGRSFRLKERPTLPGWALPKQNNGKKPEPERAPMMTVEEAVKVQNSEGVPYGNLSTDKPSVLTIEAACKIETSENPPRRYGDLPMSELSARFNELSKQLKANHLEPDERALKERKVKAAKMLIDAKRNGEL